MYPALLFVRYYLQEPYSYGHTVASILDRLTDEE